MAAKTQVGVQVARAEMVTMTKTMAEVGIGDCPTLLDFRQLLLPLLSPVRAVAWVGEYVA